MDQALTDLGAAGMVGEMRSAAISHLLTVSLLLISSSFGGRGGKLW